MDVVCVGDCGVDHYLPSGERWVGGITANFARHARREFRQDDDIRIVSCVGNDDAARQVRSALAGSGIDCHISEYPGATPVQYIEIEADGEKNFVRYDEGVLRDFRFSDEQVALIAAADLVVAPVYLQIAGLFDTLMSINTRGTIAIDFADFLQYPDFDLLDRHLRAVDIGFFGLSVADEAIISELQMRAARHDKLLVVTLGPDGSRAFVGRSTMECPAEPVDRVVDTTGAGDAYAAGFLSRWCRGAPVGEAMRHGAAVAASVVGRLGSDGQGLFRGG